MTTVQLRVFLAMILALGLAQGCSKTPPATAEPAAEAVAVPDATTSPFPPPVIEIGSDDDPKTADSNILIYWNKEGTRIDKDTQTETNGRISDEVTWRIKHFKVKDSANDLSSDVEWVIIKDGPTEKATISRVGGQFVWKVAGATPEICSWYNVSTEVPACVHDGTPLGFTGIPKSLFGFLPTFHARFKKKSTGVWVEEDVQLISLRGETCS